MGLAWQQGPLAPGSIGTFLVPEPVPARLLYAEPLRRRMRVRFGDTWIAQSDDVVLLHEPGRYPVAYFPKGDLARDILAPADRTTNHPDLGRTAWYAVTAGDRHLTEHRAVDETDAGHHGAMLGDGILERQLVWHVSIVTQ
jgi:uncharacterized protein (DUF427 family)